MVGEGVLAYSNGVIFRGTFAVNVPVSGSINYVDGSSYEGQVRDHRPEGRGKFVRDGHLQYEGQWRNGKRHGTGTLTLKSGDIFSGPFQNDERVDGDGIVTYMDGSKYAGGFVNCERHGRGVLVYPEGNIYEGPFENDLPHGDGKLTYVITPDGDKIESQLAFYGCVLLEWIFAVGLCRLISYLKQNFGDGGVDDGRFGRAVVGYAVSCKRRVSIFD
jgi:hypothetical protein